MASGRAHRRSGSGRKASAVQEPAAAINGIPVQIQKDAGNSRKFQAQDVPVAEHSAPVGFATVDIQKNARYKAKRPLRSYFAAAGRNGPKLRRPAFSLPSNGLSIPVLKIQ